MSDETRTAASAHAPRYASLEDYLHVIRRRRLMIAIFAALGLIAGIAFAVTRTDMYSATASLSVRDISQDLRSFGVDAMPETPPEVLANVNAELITRPQITNRVVRELEGEVSRQELAGAVQGRVATRTGFVLIAATAADPETAALIANAYAEAAQDVATRQLRQRLDEVLEELSVELDRFEAADPAELPGLGFRITLLEGQLSRVRTLRAIAQPVQIARSASPPQSPDSMGPASSAVIGGLIGLLLGLVAAFARDALDRRVRNAHEVHRELDRPVLGRIPESALGFPGLLQNGAKPMWDSDFEAFRALRTNLGYLNAERPNGSRPVRCLLVTSAMPEEGKSTVSMSLASAAATAGQRVLLIEGDLRRPCFAKRLDIPPSPGLSDYLRGDCDPKDIVRTLDLTRPRPSAITRPQASPVPAEATETARLACVVAGGTAADSAELLLDPRLGQMLEVVRRAYDLVIIDSSPALAVADPLELVQHVDAVLVCVRAHVATHHEVRALRAVLATLPERPTSAIVTGLRRGGPDSYEYYYGY